MRATRARDQDLRAEAPRLLERTTGQLVARDAAGKSEIVLDPRGRPSLSAGRLALDDDRAQPLGCAVDGGRKAGRPATDDHDVVFVRAGAGLQAEAIRQIAHLGPNEQLSVREPEHRKLAVRWTGAGPDRRELRRIGRHPAEGNLVAREKPAQVAARRVPAVADDRHARRGRLGGDALEPSHPLARQRAHLERDVLRDRRDRVVLLRIDPDHARRLHGTVSAGKRRPEGHRHLAEDRARKPQAEPAFDPVDRLHDLDLAGEHGKQRALAAFGNRELARTEVEVGGRARESFQLGGRQPGEQGNRRDVLDRQHEMFFMEAPRSEWRRSRALRCRGAFAVRRRRRPMP